MLKARIKNTLKKIASLALKEELSNQKKLAAVYQETIEASHERNALNNTCEGIVFSKDRAMQLHGLLSSYFALVKNPAPLHILYTTSNEAHDKSYQELKTLFAQQPISFIPETNFKKDLEKLLRQIHSSTLFFMTDDGLFVDGFDLNDILTIDPILAIPSPIKGLDLTYCYIQDRQQSLPDFIIPADLPLLPGMKCWEWKNADKGSDWAYPLSLDLSFYNKKEIEILIKHINYQAPNSLESALHQGYFSIFSERKGICFEKAKYVNIVCNVVNTEHPNRNSRKHSAEELLKKWEEGYMISHEVFFGKSPADAEQSSFVFVKR